MIIAFGGSFCIPSGQFAISGSNSLENADDGQNQISSSRAVLVSQRTEKSKIVIQLFITTCDSKHFTWAIFFKSSL